MRGRISVMDLYDKPFNIIHEFLYYTFTIKEEREKQRLEEEKAKQAEADKQKRKEKALKRTPYKFDRPLSPAAQARESKHNKSQADEQKREEINSSTTGSIAPPSDIDMEDIVDMLEEGI